MTKATRRRILILDGHPDPRGEHFVHGLATAYREAAQAAGHEVRTIAIASLDFPLLRSPDEFQHGIAPVAIAAEVGGQAVLGRQ